MAFEGALWTRWLSLQPRIRNRVVLIDATADRRWTAGAVTDAAKAFAPRLAAYRAGDRIAFRLPNGIEWLALFLALQRRNLAAIPLDAALPEEGCRETAERFGASALYLGAEFLPLTRTTRRRKSCSVIKVTSGSSALPKAVECSAAHLLADGRHIITTMKIRSRDLNLAVIPLGHSYGLGNLVLPLILQGTAMVCAQDYVPRQLLQWIHRHRVTVFPAVPALLRVLAALPKEKRKMAALRTVISAGAILTPAVARDFHERFGLKVHNFYGSSETGGICFDRTGSASLTGRSVGKPMAGVTVGIQAGRVTVKSAAVATRTGRWRLSDFGEWNSRGELVLLGRAGQGANIGGKKVHPLEVERVLRSFPGVSDAAVWLRQNGGRDHLVAVIETTRTRLDLAQSLATRLPAWQMPKHYLVASDLPRNSRGKLDLAALKNLL